MKTSYSQHYLWYDCDEFEDATELVAEVEVPDAELGEGESVLAPAKEFEVVVGEATVLQVQVLQAERDCACM